MTNVTKIKKLVLACDDNADILDFIAVLLRNSGFEVRTALNYREFMAEFGTTRPDLILLDIRMPERDGFWIAEQLQDLGNKSPVIFLTAHDRPVYRLCSPLAGAVDFLTKPILPEVLIEKIKRALAIDPTSSNWFLQSVAYMQRGAETSRGA